MQVDENGGWVDLKVHDHDETELNTWFHLNVEIPG